ncbi:hypothetical protein [Methanococcoides sp. FTZ1]|uniref:hypothetical protein n=1 Tax=Methanococcoides sp. FTZ1 TaxID=3439061 RepID=UPI003F8494B2
MSADEIEILVDLDRLPKEIGTIKERGKRMFETNDVGSVIEWIENKLVHDRQAVLLTGHLPNWMMAPICHYIDTNERIEKFRYSTPGMAIYTVFDYTGGVEA